MADLPEHHHHTRWWLKRFCSNPSYPRPNRVQLFDRVLRVEVGQDFPYPSELTTALEQLRSLRARDKEIMDEYIFCDGHGNV